MDHVALRSKSLTQMVIGFAPPLKYGPTGVTGKQTELILLRWFYTNDRTGCKHIWTQIEGAPLPYGGTHAALALTT